MSYKEKEKEQTEFKRWRCKHCSYQNKAYLCCARSVYNNSKCAFCGINAEDNSEANLNAVLTFEVEDEKEWMKLIKADNDRFMDSTFITPEAYRLDEDFVNPSYDLNPPHATFKAECIDTQRFTEKEWYIILKKANTVLQNKDIESVFKAQQSAGFNVDIKQGDCVGIEHIMAALLYIHFPQYIYKYRVSLPSKFFHFHRFIYEFVTYFGSKMPPDMVVYHGLTGGLNVTEEKAEKKEETKDEDDDDDIKRKNDEWQFLNTGFLTFPFSACRETNVFSSGTLMLSLKAQFLNEFNDTRYIDLAPLSSFAEKDGRNELLFMGEFSELSVHNISVKGDTSDTADFKAYIAAINLWQMLSTGLADFNDTKYSIENTKETQEVLVKLLKEDKEVPKYIQQMFKYYNQSKSGTKYHRCYDELLDIDFSNICKNMAKLLSKELQSLLFNDDVSDVDPAKIKKIFSNGKKYKNNAENEQNL